MSSLITRGRAPEALQHSGLQAADDCTNSISLEGTHTWSFTEVRSLAVFLYGIHTPAKPEQLVAKIASPTWVSTGDSKYTDQSNIQNLLEQKFCTSDLGRRCLATKQASRDASSPIVTL